MGTPTPPPPPASFGTFLLEPLTYDDGTTIQTYGIQARIEITPAAGEELGYVSLYRQLVNGGTGAPQESEEFVADMEWYASHPDPMNKAEYYEGIDYGYYEPFNAAHKWNYYVKIFVIKYLSQNSPTQSYP